MASFDAHACRISKATVGILLLSAAAAFRAASAQSALERTPSSDREQQIVEKIREMQSQDGPYSPDLIEPWTALSLLYEEEGLPDFATAAIDQARQTVRVNYGLYSLEEAPLLRRALHIEQGRDDTEAAMDIEEELLTLARHHPDDLRIVPILREMGDKRADVLQRYLGGEMPAEITLGCYYQGGRQLPAEPLLRSASANCLSGSRRVAIQALATEALAYYRNAIGVMVKNGRYTSDELEEMESQLIRISYSSSRYAVGKQSYRRLIGYNAASSAPWLERIETFVEMTDWDLFFSQRAGRRALSDTLDAYRQSHDLLEKKGVAQTSIDAIFAPTIPVVLPAFLPNPLASRNSGSGRYIDVAFDITKYGRSEHVDVLDTSKNATSSEQNDIARLVKRSVFRPRTKDGRFDEASRVVVRYHLPSAPVDDRVSQR